MEVDAVPQLWVFNAVCEVSDTRLCTVEAEDYEHAAKRVLQLLELEPALPRPKASILVQPHPMSRPVPDENYFDDAYFSSARARPAARAYHH